MTNREPPWHGAGESPPSCLVSFPFTFGENEAGERAVTGGTSADAAPVAAVAPGATSVPYCFGEPTSSCSCLCPRSTASSTNSVAVSSIRPSTFDFARAVGVSLEASPLLLEYLAFPALPFSTLVVAVVGEWRIAIRRVSAGSNLALTLMASFSA